VLGRVPREHTNEVFALGKDQTCMRARSIATLFVLPAAAFVLAGCGGGGADDGARDAAGDAATTSAASDTTDTGDAAASQPAASGGTTLDLGVQGDKLAFDKQSLEAPAGTVTLRLTNTSALTHDIGVSDADGNDLGEGDLAGKGETSTVTVELEPGTYTYFCGPHRSAGMTGVLTVS
jgi:plastocyanin